MTDSKLCSVTENFSDFTNIAGFQPTHNQTFAFVNLDLPAILREYSDTLMEFYERGRNSLSPTPTSFPTSNKCNISSPSTMFIGVFDNGAYGVYNSSENFLKSKNYWHTPSLKHQEFETQDAALRFARSGVAQLNGVPENAIPPMQFPLNWRQKI